MMGTFAIPVFILMLGAGILSAIIAWRLRGDQLIKLNKEFDKFRLDQSDHQIELKALKESATELTTTAIEANAQNTVLEEENKALNYALIGEKEKIEELYLEFNTFKASVRNSEKQIHQLHDEILVLKTKLKAAEEKSVNWKEKYNTLRSVQVKDEKAPVSKSVPQAASSVNGSIKQQNEEENFKKLRKKYEELSKAKNALAAELNVFQGYKSKYDHYLLSMEQKELEMKQLKEELAENRKLYQKQLAEQESISLQYKSLLEGNGQFESELNQTKENYGQLLKDYEKQITSLEIVSKEQKKLERKFTQKQKELQLIQQENEELNLQLQSLNDIVKQRTTKSEITTKNRALIIQKIKQKKNKLDWSSIGKVAKEDGDNLKKLRGLGSFVEQKMNAIGIFSLNQIAKLSPKDEDLLNELLELPKSKFQKQEWVLQSRRLLGLINNDQPATILNRVQQKKSLVNFDRIGIAAPANKDNLQLIKDISPFEEAKLNALGIYKFSQFINMEVDDLAFVNGALEIADGRIVNEDWVAQATSLFNANKKISLDRIRERKNNVDFERIGKSRRGLKDNLQLINGIGKFTEQKLNAIGIFNFSQIAQFNKEDVIEINNLIELPSGYIKNDNWVAQAKKLIEI